MKDIIPMPSKTITLDIKAASAADLVKFYNANSGSKPITKFADRKTAEKRVAELIQAHNELAGGSSKETVVKKATKATKQEASSEEGTRGRSSAAEGKRIYKVGEFKKTNPRREGTHGFKSWEAISKDGISYDDFIAAGGRNRDLMHDVKLGRIELK